MHDIQPREYVFDWGAFALIEFLGSCQHQIGSKYKTALDIGSGQGVQTDIMTHELTASVSRPSIFRALNKLEKLGKLKRVEGSNGSYLTV